MNMNKIKKYISGKGLYKIAFCICSLIMCFVTVMVAEYEDDTQKTQSITNGQEVFEVETKHVQSGKVDAKFDSDLANDDAANKTQKEHNGGDEVAENVKHINAEEENVIFDTSFSPPHMGEVIKPFSVNSLIYSKTMDDWRIHEGIDISAEIGSDVFASQDGKVIFAGHDISKGYVVKVQNGGFECIYASLSAELPVSEGDIVKKGQYIGTVSDSQVEEICDDSHLHFEIYVNGECVNPEEYIYN